MVLLLISIVAGVLTVLAPCVLPLLPVVVGGSVSGKGQRFRPYIIAASLAGSIIIFTLLLKVSTSLANVSVVALDYLSGGLLVALGLIGVFPELWEQLITWLNLQSATQHLLGETEQHQGFLGPVLIGLALGPVFSSCSPTYAFILASVLPRDFASGLIYLISYSLALVVTLLMIALTSKRLVSRLKWVIDTHGWFRRGLGAVFIAIGIMIMLGQEVRFETWLAGYLPFDETKIEQILLAEQHQSIAAPSAETGVLNVQATPAPEVTGLTNWINSTPLTLSQLKGSVVLVDFWTYSCVNCNRALPYVEKWYKAYQKDGLVVIGVHTPEFAFEHIAGNVQQFVKSNNITYPVALDNDYATWNAFQNDSWPADYLIDKQGDIRYVALGEGDYDVTEKAIQQLLGINQPLQTPTSVVPISNTQTPETYFGTNRAANFEGSPALLDGTHTFTPSAINDLLQDYWTLGGTWQISAENITSQSANAELNFRVGAKDVYVVAGSVDGQSHKVSVGLPSAHASEYGSDAPSGVLNINGSKLYHIVSLKQFGATLVTLIVPKGVSLYTFTFGS